jgi:hypothetical protein
VIGYYYNKTNKWGTYSWPSRSLQQWSICHSTIARKTTGHIKVLYNVYKQKIKSESIGENDLLTLWLFHVFGFPNESQFIHIGLLHEGWSIPWKDSVIAVHLLIFRVFHSKSCSPLPKWLRSKKGEILWTFCNHTVTTPPWCHSPKLKCSRRKLLWFAVWI